MVADWLATAGSALGNLFTKWYKNRKKSDDNGDNNMGLWSKVKGWFGNNSSSALSSALNTITSAKFQERQYQYNKALLGYQQDWQEKMSNSAHTREVADLRNAGLNPILSATGGSGAAYGSASAPSVGMPDVSPGTDAISAKTAYKNMSLMDSQKDNTDANTKLVDKETMKTTWDALQSQQMYDDIMPAQLREINQRIENSKKITSAQVQNLLDTGRASIISANASLNNANTAQQTYQLNKSVQDIIRDKENRYKQWGKEHPNLRNIDETLGRYLNGISLPKFK
jgi:hypothetical protein